MRGRGGSAWTWRAAAGVAVVASTFLPASTAVAAGRSSAPTPVCEITDRRLNEISGMVATDDGFVVVNDGADDESYRRIFFLDEECGVRRAVRYPSPPRDTEDLAVGPDGTVWVGDIGDNDRDRETIALWQLRPGAQRPVLYRLAYPDKPHDAEALLITGDGRPLIVSKSSTLLYRPATALRPGATTPLEKVGAVRLPNTTTSNPFSIVGRSVVTGAATAPDGKRVVLRTYADAFEFDVPDGDVVAALTGGTPRVTPLPDEPQGEAVTYSRDGRSLLTVSETAGQPPGTPATILRYALAEGPATTAPSTPDGASPGGSAVPAAERTRESDRSPVGFGAAAALGLAVFALGIAGAVRARRSGRR